MPKTPRLREEHIRLILTSNQPPSQLAPLMGVSPDSICAVRMGRTYRDVLPELPRRRQTFRKLRLDEIRLILVSRENSRLLSEQLGVSREAINAIRRGKAYADVLPELARNPIEARRFSATEITAIRASSETNYALAKRYGINHKTVAQIRNRILYADIDTIPQVHCLRCRHWNDGCGFGLPEAQENGAFAAECLHYTS